MSLGPRVELTLNTGFQVFLLLKVIQSSPTSLLAGGEVCLRHEGVGRLDPDWGWARWCDAGEGGCWGGAERVESGWVEGWDRRGSGWYFVRLGEAGAQLRVFCALETRDSGRDSPGEEIRDNSPRIWETYREKSGTLTARLRVELQTSPGLRSGSAVERSRRPASPHPRMGGVGCGAGRTYLTRE